MMGKNGEHGEHAKGVELYPPLAGTFFMRRLRVDGEARVRKL